MIKKGVKKLYELIPFKKQLFIVLKLVYQPRESIFKHLHFHGVIDVKVDSHARFKMNHGGYQIENEVFWRGVENGWEKNSVSIWIKLARKANNIIDIGANTGIYALIAQAVNPRANIYAFEALPRVQKMLEDNIKLNGYNIKSYPIAISDANGKAHVYDEPLDPNNYSVTVNKNMSPENAGVKIEIDIITLDSFIEANGIAGIDLIKVDVETHEGEVMEGFRKHLTAFQPTFLIEILRNEVGEKVQRCLEGLDYLYYNIDENGAIIRVNDIRRMGHHYNYLLCSPATARVLGLLT